MPARSSTAASLARPTETGAIIMDSKLTGSSRRLPRRLAQGAAALSMLAMSVFASTASAEVNTTGLAVTDTEVTVGQLHSATGTMAISETGSIQPSSRSTPPAAFLVGRSR